MVFPFNLFDQKDLYDPVRLHAGDETEIAKLPERLDRELMEIRPYIEANALENAENLISTFNQPQQDLDDPHVYTFEMWFSNGKLRFFISTPNKQKDAEVRSQIAGMYNNAQITDAERVLPVLPEDGYITGGRFDLSDTIYAPIRSFSGPENFDVNADNLRKRDIDETIDPYMSLTSEITGHESEAVMVQFVIKTAPEDWVNGRGLFQPKADLVVRGLDQGRFVDSLTDPRIADPTEKDKNASQFIGDIEGMQAFDVDIRYFVVDPERENAVRHAKQIESEFSSIYKNDKVDQQLVGDRFDDEEMRDMLIKMGLREFDGDNHIPLTKGELAALAHIPDGDIQTDQVDWVRSAFGGSVPGDANAVEKQHLADKDVSDEEHQFAESNEYNTAGGEFEEAEEGTLFEKAKQIVNRTDSAYYRDGVTADDYPVTEAIEENVPQEKQDEFLKYCAAYERGDINEDDVAEDFGEEHAEKMVVLIEDHIEESYLIRAKRQSSGSESGDSENEYDYNVGQPELPEGGDGVKLPDVQEQQDTNTSQGHKEPDKLPDTTGKYAVNFVDETIRKTRTERGVMTNINFQQTGSDGNLYMGEDVRDLYIEDHDRGDETNIWLGYQEKTDNPTKEVPWEANAWFRHCAIFGTTGMGKSTLLVNIMNQVARMGHGFVCVDPSDSGDLVNSLMESLPEDRLDDVIWIEPGDHRHDKVASINFLEPSVGKDDPRFDREVESIVDDLQKILKAGGYWGAKMEGITKNITRAMVRSKNPYTLYDMYHVLVDEESRWNFAKSIERESLDYNSDTNASSIADDIKTYSEQIAKMEEDEIDPVVRRLQDWVESPINKEIVSNRYSSIDFQEVIDEGKIILANLSINAEAPKRVISTAVIRRLWSAVQVREETTPDSEIDPYFAFLDEFHDIVSRDMDVEQMLAKARSGRLSVTMASQNPSQIESVDEGEIMDQVWNNTETLISFAVRGQKDSQRLADRFGEGFEPSDMKKMSQYRAVTQISFMGEHGPEVSDPIDLRTFAPYPPLLSERDVEKAIQASLDEYGDIPLENNPRDTDLLVTGGLANDSALSVVESIWNLQMQYSSDTVPLSDVIERYNRQSEVKWEDYPKGIGIDEEWIEIPNHNITELDRGIGEDSSVDVAYKEGDQVYIVASDGLGDVDVAVTPEGVSAVLEKDDGRGETNDKHRSVIRDGFRWFSRLGYDCSIPEQSGTEEVCDGKANLPVDESGSRRDIREAVEQFLDSNEIAQDWFGEEDINWEAETTTRKKPSKTIENLARGVRNHKHVVFMVEDGREDGHGMDYHAERVENILTDPPLYKRDLEAPPGTDPDDISSADSAKELYNRSDKLQLGDDDDEKKFPLIHSGNQSKWVDVGDGIELYAGSGGNAKKRGEVKYSEVRLGSANAFDIWCRYDPYEDEWIVYPGGSDNERYNSKRELRQEYTFVRGPLHPESIVDGQVSDDMWSVLITPNPEAAIEAGKSGGGSFSEDLSVEQVDTEYPPEEVPLVYEDGDTQPLISDQNVDLLTGPRNDGESEDTTEEENVLSLEEVEKRMSSLEQIKMEKQVKEQISTLKQQRSQEQKQKLSEYDDKFGANNPGEVSTWKGVWDHFSREYDTGIPASYLSQAVMSATGLTKDKAEDAVEAGVEFDILVKGEAKQTDTLDEDIQQDDIYRLALPEEKPHLYVDDAERFAERGTWSDVWSRVDYADETTPLKKTALTQLLIKSNTVNTEIAASAALHVGEQSESVVFDPDVGYKLCSDRPNQIWLEVWESHDTDIEDAMQKDDILVNLGIQLMGESVDAQERFDEGVEKGEIYTHDGIDDNEYIINDPATDVGPDVDVDNDDDDDDDDDNDGSGEETPDDDDDDDGGAGEVEAKKGSTTENTSGGGQRGEDGGSNTPNDDTAEQDPTIVTADNSESTVVSDSETTPTDNSTEDNDSSSDSGDDEEIPSVELELDASNLLISDDKQIARKRDTRPEEDDNVDGETQESEGEEGDVDGDIRIDEPPVDDIHIELPQDELDQHYERAKPVYDVLGSIGRFPTQLVYDFYGWYITEDNEAFNSDLDLEDNLDNPAAFPKKRRPVSADGDLDHIIDEVERSLYALTTYKSESVFNRWKAGRWKTTEDGTRQFEYSLDGEGNTPTANSEDTRAMMVWGDIDLPSSIKAQRGDLDDDLKAKIEQVIEAYIEGFQSLYGSMEPIYALDSVGGVYVMGSPTTTMPIVNYFRDIKQDEEAIGLVFEEFKERSNEYLAGIEDDVNELIDGADDVLDPDWVNNVNRQYKAPLSVHKDLPGIVTPIETHNVSFDYTHFDDVDDDLIDNTVEWAEGLTDIDHREHIDSVIETLWRDYYEKADGDWKKALSEWVDDERERKRKEKEKRRQARKQALEQDSEEVDGDINLTSSFVNLDRAVGRVSTKEILQKYAAAEWDTGISHTNKVEFNPGWRTSQSGTSCVYYKDNDHFVDAGDSAGGYADMAIALAEGIIDKPSKGLDGEDWGEAVNKLRQLGYDIPHFIPDVGSKKRHDDGCYEQTPNWAMKKCAVMFGVCIPDDFVEEENEDGDTFERLTPQHYAETVEILQEEYGYEVTPGEPDTDDSDASQNGSNESDPITDTEDKDGVADASAVFGGDEVDVEGKTEAEAETEAENNNVLSSVTIPTDTTDADTYAITQFVKEHCTINVDDDDTKVATQTVMDAFMAWVDENEIGDELDDLSPDTYIDMRMSNLKTALEDTFGIENSRRRLNNTKCVCFIGVELNDDIKNLIE